MICDLRQAAYMELLAHQHRRRRPSRIVAIAAILVAPPVEWTTKRAEIRKLYRRVS